MSGPEIADQLSMLANVDGTSSSLQITPLSSRIETLKSFSISEAKKVAKPAVNA
jgi:hypothetical protein